jgi:multicomponent Na+:H+ antiporter subunit C
MTDHPVGVALPAVDGATLATALAQAGTDAATPGSGLLEWATGPAAWATHVVYALLVGIGLFVLVNDRNLVKKVIGLNVFQTGVFLFLVTSGYRSDGAPPLVDGPGPFVNPLPHVLVLTAIVVGVAVTAVALVLVGRLYDEYGTLDEAVIREIRARRAGLALAREEPTAGDSAQSTRAPTPPDSDRDTEGSA